MDSESLVIEEIEDTLLLSAMQQAGDELGSLDEAKAHLMKVAGEMPSC